MRVYKKDNRWILAYESKAEKSYLDECFYPEVEERMGGKTNGDVTTAGRPISVDDIVLILQSDGLRVMHQDGKPFGNLVPKRKLAPVPRASWWRRYREDVESLGQTLGLLAIVAAVWLVAHA